MGYVCDFLIYVHYYSTYKCNININQFCLSQLYECILYIIL